MTWLVLAAIPAVCAYWLVLFGRFVDGESERDHVDAVRLALVALALAALLVHAPLVAAAALGLQALVRTAETLPRLSPRR